MTNKYNGIYKEYIILYLKNRELTIGRIDAHYASCLKKFDKYTIENPTDLAFTKEYIEKWLILKENESLNTLAYRASVIKSFSIYLNSYGINCYIINKKNYPSVKEFVPHIYTNNEIKSIIDSIDMSIINTFKYPHKKEMYKLLIELLYSCGLRLSEALNIKYNDINFNNKTICINESKNYITRNIIINQYLENEIKSYKAKFINLKDESYLFNNIKYGYHIVKNTVEADFKKIIKNSKLDKSKRYRLHDFRHTFAVNNLKKVFLSKEDINVFLPILMTYMGHQNIKSTEYYLRFTADVYPEFIKEYEKYFNNIIPILEVDRNE